MDTEHHLGRLVRELPLTVRLACEALEHAGFIPSREIREMGGYAWIECRTPEHAANLGNYRQLASRALRKKGGLNVSPDSITIHDLAGRVMVRVPIRTRTEPAPEQVAERLVFKPSKGGTTVAVKPFPPSALLKTYEDFFQELEEIRIVVLSRKKKKVSGHDLRKQFAGTELAKAATENHWDEWYQGFLSGQLTSKNASLVLLEDTTGFKRSSLKTILSKARSRR